MNGSRLVTKEGIVRFIALAFLSAAALAASGMLAGDARGTHVCGPNAILGTPGNDVLFGTGGDDTICGMGGEDVIRGFGGDDYILGGSGTCETFPAGAVLNAMGA